MGMRNNPVTYLIISNSLLWGLPLTIIQMQSLMADRDQRVAEMAQVRPTPVGDALMSLEPLIQPDPLAQLAPLTSRIEAVPIAQSTPATSLPVLQSSGKAVDAMEIPAMPPNLLTQLNGADGLGGPITLASRKDPLVPVAVRAERLQWERSNDALAALPLHWRDSLRQELGAGVRVSQASTVRLPVRELAERQEVPVIINDQGVAEGLVEPRHQRTREAVETWAARQQPAEPGTVQVLLIAAEPLAPAQE
jgi:hypothetical protein